jgi:Reverse transcriptase (RNA-dependent DNA polymerase)
MINFVDFKKAFDSVHRASIWKILEQYGIPENVIEVIHNLYKNSKRAVRMNGHIGVWFQIITGVRQGCILSPILFAVAIDWVMRRTTHNDAGITWVDGKKLKDLDIADDIALICDNHADMQTLTSIVENESAKIGLLLNGGKCNVMVSES